MKNTILIFLTSFILFSCQGDKAIEICQRSKIQFQNDNGFENLANIIFSLNANATWLDMANMIAQKEPNNKYEWSAKETDVKGVYMVSFKDKNGWGHRWEVVVDEQIVKYINKNKYLSRKYGLHRLDESKNFKISTISIDTLRVFTNYGNREVDYKLVGKVINRTGKILTSSEINGDLQVIFKDKTISGSSTYYSGFIKGVTKANPWKPDVEKEFKIITKSIEGIYLDYSPEYVVFELNIIATDPIGFEFDKNILEMDLKSEWSKYSKQAKPKIQKYYTTKERVSVFSSPSSKSKKIGYLDNNVLVGGIAFVDSEWIKIKTSTKDGYVQLKYLKEKK